MYKYVVKLITNLSRSRPLMNTQHTIHVLRHGHVGILSVHVNIITTLFLPGKVVPVHVQYFKCYRTRGVEYYYVRTSRSYGITYTSMILTVFSRGVYG